MQHIVSNLKNSVAQFVEQRQNLTLAMTGDQGGVSLAVSLLRELEQYPGTDVFLMVAGNFTDADSYTDQIIEQIQIECELMDMALEEDGLPAPTTIPEDLRDRSKDWQDRFAGAVEFCKQLIPDGGGHRLVVGLFPLQISDGKQFQQMLLDLSPRSGYRSWMRDVRMVGYDHSGEEPEILESVRGVQLERLDFTHASIQAALEADAVNESLSDVQRVNAVHQLAIYDYGLGRPDDAHEKFDYLLGYYQGTEDLQMQALVMQGKGDVFRKQKKYEDARHWYECAISPAEQSKSVPALQAVTRALGELERETGNTEAATQYLQYSSQLAATRGDVTSMSCCEEHQVHSLAENSQLSEASQVLESSTERSRELGLDHELEQQLELLIPIYQAQGNETGLAAAKSELQRIKGEV